MCRYNHSQICDQKMYHKQFLPLYVAFHNAGMLFTPVFKELFRLNLWCKSDIESISLIEPWWYLPA